MEGTISIGWRVRQLATEDPGRVAVLSERADGSAAACTWGDLERLTNSALASFVSRGVQPDDLVAVAVPNTLDHVVATVGLWKLGATVVALSPATTPDELERLVRLAMPVRFAVTDRDELSGAGPTITTDELRHGNPDRGMACLPADAPRAAYLTGGTTGAPRIVVSDRRFVFEEPGPDARDDFLAGETQLVVAPLHHLGFKSLYWGLLFGQLIVLPERFAPRSTLRLIERHGVNLVRLTPTHMKWLIECPDFEGTDLSSVRSLQHMAAPCPVALKQRWVDALGPDRVMEIYASREDVYLLRIRGPEWLRHRGSVGAPGDGNVLIVDESGAPVPTGTIGEVFIRSTQPGSRFLDDGPPVRSRPGGFRSVGDLGYLDDDGYLYLVDRQSEMFIVGGVNVYPAQIEAVLVDMAGVADAAVVPLEHRDLGLVPKAFIVRDDPTLSTADVARHCRSHLSEQRLPIDYEFVEKLPRDSAGKLRRRLLAGSPRDWATVE